MDFASKKAYISRSKKQEFIEQQQIQRVRVAPKSKMLASIAENDDDLMQTKALKKKPARKNSFDEVLDEELNMDAQLLSDKSNSSDEEMEAPVIKKKKIITGQRKFKPGGNDYKKKYEQEIDSNVMSVKFNVLKELGEVASGDPIICKSCGAILNKFSKLTNSDQENVLQPMQELKEEVKESAIKPVIPALNKDQSAWCCEFCGFVNVIEIDPEEIPVSDGVNYILESAVQAKEAALGKSESQDITVIFCIDISGSMCISKPMKGTHQLKGDRLKDLRNELRKFGDGSSQLMENEAKNLTYISRLQCAQAAIQAQIQQMQIAAPKRKVGVITFAKDVCVIGDGSGSPKIFAGDRLNDKEFIVSASKKLKESHLSSPIDKSFNKLSEMVGELEEGGPTALGPALLSSVTMAASGKPGSKVIICTDGLANVGMGSLDELKTDEDHKKAEEFYEGIGVFAKEEGVNISVITIKGQNSKLEYLSTIAEESGGQLIRVTPEKLTEEFSNILANPVIATHVKARVFLQKCMEFRNQDKNSLSQDKSMLVRDLGNVTSETEITFEYTLKVAEELLKIPPFMNINKLQYLPFQVQIQYTALDGKKCVRVLSKIQQTSEEKEKLMQNANVKLLSLNAKSNLAKHALSGQYRQSQATAKLYLGSIQSRVKNSEESQQFTQLKRDVKKLYSNLQRAQMEEDEAMGGESKSSSYANRKQMRPDTITYKAKKMSKK